MKNVSATGWFYSLVLSVAALCAQGIVVQDAEAVSISIDAAADNTLHSVWVVENGVTTQTLNLDYSWWRDATNFDISFDDTKHVELYFLAENSDTRNLSAAQNPGGLLAQFSSDDARFDGIVTSDQWQMSLDMNSWESAAEWGHNGDSSTIWWVNNQSRPVSDIDLGASWIWYTTNFTDSQPGVGDSLYFRFELTSAAAVPEPGTMALLGVGVCGLFAKRRKVSAASL